MVAKNARETIQTLLTEMRPLLLLASCPKHQIRVRSGSHRIQSCSTAFDWLHNLYLSDAYSDVKKIYNLLPEETWRRYKLFNFEGLREQELLKNACRALWLAWRKKRPSLFNKDRNDKETSRHEKPDHCRA